MTLGHKWKKRFWALNGKKLLYVINEKNDSRSWALGSKWKKMTLGHKWEKTTLGPKWKKITLGHKWEKRLWVMSSKL